MKIRVMTYNIASGRCYEDTSKISLHGGCPVDLSRAGSVIKEAAPDICGLNEINVYLSGGTGPANQPLYLSEYTGMRECFFGKSISVDNSNARRDYGNAVISSHPIESGRIVHIPDTELHDEPRYYEHRSISVVKIGLAGGITVLQTHMGLAIAESKNATLEVLRLLDEIEGPVILMGDFNMRPSNPLIDMLRERLFDTALVSDGYIPTFPSYVYPEGVRPGDYSPPCKIDYIFVSKHFKTLSLRAIDIPVSDHRPLVAELEID
jgi:endonuclease/exonuclease/phosphatase family metal-dependent hydrolase